MTELFDAEQFWSQVCEFNRHQIENMKTAIRWRENALYATYLQRAGFKAFWQIEGSQDLQNRFFDYVLVGHDIDPETEWATPEECQQLLDTATNLPANEAWKRWVWKKQPRCDNSVFDLESAKEWRSVAIAQFMASVWGQQFPQDVDSIRLTGMEIQQETYNLINARKSMQKEFLELVRDRGMEKVQESWVETLTELGGKYKFSRAHTRDAIQWAMQNQHRFQITCS